jgi:hypothetical protein
MGWLRREAASPPAPQQPRPGSDRAWLDVPYAEKGTAKAAGARWDQAARRWYAPQPGMAALAKWRALPPLPMILPGEDREFGSGLFVDLVPSSCWFTNIRSATDGASWDRLRRMVYQRAGNRCEACGRMPDPAAGVRLEAHERWSYDAQGSVQVLRRLICLCSDCHGATHMGLAQVQGRSGQAVRHLQAVTGMTAAEADGHVQAAFALWHHRSARTWSLDLTIITAAGLVVTPPGSASRRHQIAGERWLEERGG